MTENREKMVEYATDLRTYLRPGNIRLLKEILQRVVHQVRVKPGPEQDSAFFKIIYKIPMPPDDWRQGANVEQFLLRKASRSLSQHA